MHWAFFLKEARKKMISSGMHEYMRVRQYIVDMCHHMVDAEHPLPSERQISEQFHVSRSTARRALSDLVEAHYLIKSPKRGYFVNPSNFGRFQGKIIGFVNYDSMSAFISGSELQALAALYAEAAKFPVAIQSILCPNPAQLAEDLRKGALDGVLWYSVPDNRISCYNQLVRSGIPTVAIFQGGREPEIGGDYIYLDHRGEEYLQTRYLLERGAKRIIFPRLPEESFSEGYFKAYREAGLTPDEEWLFSETSFAADLPDYIRNGGIDGIICRYTNCTEALAFAHENNIAVPEKLQIITGTSIWSGTATRTLKPYQKMFRLCLKQLWERMNGRERPPMQINSLEWSVVSGTTTKE